MLGLNVEPKHKDNAIKKKNIFYSSKPCSLHEKDKKGKQMQNSSLAEVGAGSKVPNHHWVEEVIRSLRRDKLEIGRKCRWEAGAF